MAAGRKTGGRARGTPNKSTLYRNALVEEGRRNLLESGLLPYDLLLLVSRGAPEAQHITPQMIDAAKALLPYTMPRLVSTQNTTSVYVDGRKILSHEDRLRLLEAGPHIDGEAEEVEP